MGASTSPPVRTVSFKWILIGAGAIIGIHFLMHPALAVTIGGMIRGIGIPASLELFAYQGLLAVIAYFVGGLLVGWLSPGETLKEPALAGIIGGVILNAVEASVWPESFSYLAALFGIAVGFGTALAGAWVGERLQGDTTEKMRERGELPPTS